MKSWVARMKKAMITISQCDHEHRDLDEILEEGDRSDQIHRLLEKRPGGLEARAREPSRHQQFLCGFRAAARDEAEPRKGAEHDFRKRAEAVQDEREGADVKYFLQEFCDDIVFPAERPEQAGERDVDPDEDGCEEADVRPEQPEAAIDIGDERLHEPVDDIEIVHSASRPR